MRLRLLVADDHQLMLAAVRLALRDAADIDIVGEARSGAEVLPLAGQTSPDVALLDLRMPGMGGLRCLELLQERYPSVKSVVFSGNDDSSAVVACLARGAAAFVHKSIDPRELAGAIRKAVAGEEFFSVGKTSAVRAPERDVDLTPRETEILRAVADGMPNKQIAGKLWLSEQTIKYHLTNLYRKLHVTSRTEAIRYAYEHGLLESPVLRMAASPA
jgi:DNA-binding NarL/FixJ family response regulator